MNRQHAAAFAMAMAMADAGQRVQVVGQREGRLRKLPIARLCSSGCRQYGLAPPEPHETIER